MTFYHSRNWFDLCTGISAKGGFTAAMEELQPWFFETLLPGDSFEKRIGVAKCHPDENFCKKTGREVAEKNAKLRKLKVVHVSLEENCRIAVLQDEQGLSYELYKYKKAKAVFLRRVYGEI